MAENLSLVDRAIVFATGKHSGQWRKGTTIPYVTHVVETLEIVSRISDDEELRAAAVLHDTLEDTDTTKEELVEHFGQRVADLVAAESENKRAGVPEEDTWFVRKHETVEHLSKATTEIRTLALGDKLANIRALYRDHMELGEALWQRFNQKNPAYQRIYYDLLAQIFAADDVLRETQAFHEYTQFCAELFGQYTENPE